MRRVQTSDPELSSDTAFPSWGDVLSFLISAEGGIRSRSDGYDNGLPSGRHLGRACSRRTRPNVTGRKAAQNSTPATRRGRACSPDLRHALRPSFPPRPGQPDDVSLAPRAAGAGKTHERKSPLLGRSECSDRKCRRVAIEPRQPPQPRSLSRPRGLASTEPRARDRRRCRN